MYSFSTPRQHAVRVVLNEDLIFKIQKRFFCDRPCEKKVKFRVTIDLSDSLILAGNSPINAVLDKEG